MTGRHEWFLLTILPLAIVALLLVVYWGIRYARIARELEHAERMKALEMGQPMARDLPWWTPLRVAVAIGVGVPLGAFALALAGSEAEGMGNVMAWPSACGVGMTGLICGTFLALKLREPAALASLRDGKPVLDPVSRDLGDSV